MSGPRRSWRRAEIRGLGSESRPAAVQNNGLTQGIARPLGGFGTFVYYTMGGSFSSRKPGNDLPLRRASRLRSKGVGVPAGLGEKLAGSVRV